MKRFLLVFGLIPSFIFAGIPAGYYDGIEGKSTADLKTALHVIICKDTANNLSYGSGAGHTWEGFYSTDRNLNTNAVIDMYSAELRYFPDPNPDFVSFGTTVQIEHSLPKSWWGGYEWAAYEDLFHLYPCDGQVNQSKSNNPLGIVTGTPTMNNGVSKIGTGVYPNYTGNVFEPSDEYKGDFARSYFYVATAYQNYANYWDSPMMDKNTFPVFNSWATGLLLEWHRNDPVSSKEIARNEAVSGFQKNRNPFIDYPKLVEYIWGNKSGMPFAFIDGKIEITGRVLDSNTTLEFVNNQTRIINIKGADLQGEISLSLTGSNAGMFTVSANTVTKENASGSGTQITIQYVPTSTGTHTGTLTISSQNAVSKVYLLTGEN